MHQIVVRSENRGELNRRRDENGSVETNPVALLCEARQLGHAKAAVAFAGDKDGGRPALVPREKLLHKFAQRFQVAFDLPELCISFFLISFARVVAGALFGDRSTEAGADGIDKD